MTRRIPGILSAFLFLAATALPAGAEGRTVIGTVSAVDAAAGTLTVTDAAGVSWSYRAERGAGIDLSDLRAGDRVAVTIARPTPFNMINAADLLRTGDRVEKTGY